VEASPAVAADSSIHFLSLSLPQLTSPRISPVLSAREEGRAGNMKLYCTLLYKMCIALCLLMDSCSQRGREREKALCHQFLHRLHIDRLLMRVRGSSSRPKNCSRRRWKGQFSFAGLQQEL
jgi:hypothetical protein